MLLVTFTGIASVFIPAHLDKRLDMALTVVLTFIILQAIVASMFPKTPSPPIVREMHIFTLQIHFGFDAI